jgi:bla regulator protein BlaR1
MVHASWQAAVLGVAVLLLCRLLGKSLQPRWRFALWLVVFARLALPIVPSSPWSLFRLGPHPTEEPASELPAPVPPQAQESQSVEVPVVAPMPVLTPAAEVPTQSADEEEPPVPEAGE